MKYMDSRAIIEVAHGKNKSGYLLNKSVLSGDLKMVQLSLEANYVTAEERG